MHISHAQARNKTQPLLFSWCIHISCLGNWILWQSFITHHSSLSLSHYRQVSPFICKNLHFFLLPNKDEHRQSNLWWNSKSSLTKYKTLVSGYLFVFFPTLCMLTAKRKVERIFPWVYDWLSEWQENDSFKNIEYTGPLASELGLCKTNENLNLAFSVIQ